MQVSVPESIFNGLAPISPKFYFRADCGNDEDGSNILSSLDTIDLLSEES
ncbi:hypothetical protein H6F89_27040 [Cyanobacteria bacterium FACHB-63]|nr:hypothetical protein [Cyanobacteria bacterium FACHB-63]